MSLGYSMVSRQDADACLLLSRSVASGPSSFLPAAQQIRDKPEATTTCYTSRSGSDHKHHCCKCYNWKWTVNYLVFCLDAAFGRVGGHIPSYL